LILLKVGIHISFSELRDLNEVLELQENQCESYSFVIVEV